MTIKTITDPKFDKPIRDVLKYNHVRGKLGVISEIVGCKEEDLIKIMKSTGELSILDRGMLVMHFFTP